MENFYLLNLGVLAAVTLYNSSNSRLDQQQANQALALYFTVGTAFLVFLAIICYHAVTYVSPIKRLWQKMLEKVGRIRHFHADATVKTHDVRATEYGHTSVELTTRESAPLLDSSNQLRDSILATVHVN